MFTSENQGNALRQELAVFIKFKSRVLISNNYRSNGTMASLMITR